MKAHNPVFTLFVLMIATFLPGPALAHCDGMDGPVVTLARKALETKNVNWVLPWVPEKEEPQILRAFDHALAVRKLGPEAMQLADSYFFETLVRIHRASEGAPYTGLKPAGIDLGPAIPAADQAIATGSIEAVEKLLADAIHKGLHEHFGAVLQHKDYDPDDVAAGRLYVETYVPYIHYVEGLWEAATKEIDGHYPEPPAEAH